MLLISCVSPYSHPLVSLALSSLPNSSSYFSFSALRCLRGFLVQLDSLCLLAVNALPTQIQCCLFPSLLHCSCVLALSVIALRLSNAYFHVHLHFPVFFCRALGSAQPLLVFTTGLLCYTETQKASFLQTRTSSVVSPCLPPSTPLFLVQRNIFLDILKPFRDLLVYQEQTRSLPSVSQATETEGDITLRNEKINPDSSAVSQAGMTSDILWQLQAEVLDA